MDFSIYRIFPALGDSIMLSTLFKEKGVTRVFYNRANLGVLEKVMKLYDVQPIEFVFELRRIPYTMVTVARDLHRDKIKLLSPKSIVRDESGYTTYQLGSHNKSAQDRNITMSEAKSRVKYSNLDFIDSQDEKYTTGPLTDVFDLLAGSKHHITCDSGTAFVSTSLGVETTIISKNSLYFNGSYFNMKYLDWHENTTVYQDDRLGVRMPTELEYYTSASRNGIAVAPYQQYIENLKTNPV